MKTYGGLAAGILLVFAAAALAISTPDVSELSGGCYLNSCNKNYGCEDYDGCAGAQSKAACDGARYITGTGNKNFDCWGPLHVESCTPYELEVCDIGYFCCWCDGHCCATGFEAWRHDAYDKCLNEF